MSPTASKKASPRTSKTKTPSKSLSSRKPSQSLTEKKTQRSSRTVSSTGAAVMGGAAATVVAPTSERERSLPRSRSRTRQERAPVQEVTMQESPTYELLLAKNQYLPIKKILTRENGQPMLRYIKAVNADGYSVYVIPDIEGVSVVQENDKIFEITENGNDIPSSTKMGALQCTDSVCSVVIECGDDQVCMIATDEVTQQPLEKTLTVTASEKARGSDNYPYPVVKLSDILKNPKIVENSIAKTTARFLKLNNQSARDGFQKLENALMGVEREISTFIPAYRAAFQNLTKSSATLAKLRIAHLDSEGSSPENVEKLRKIGYNIAMRSDMLSDLLAMGAETEALAMKMEEVRRTIAERTAHLVEKYSGLNKVHTQD